VLTHQTETIDQEFFRRKILEAAALRRRLYGDEQTYRVVFGEADGLPGLVIDKYEDVLVVQVSTFGMNVRLGEVLGAISTSGLNPRAVVLRSDTPMAELEGFTGESRVLAGVIEHPVVIEQDGISFGVDVLQGQKTGFYLDQRENRRAATGLFKEFRVLDCFCYTGAWSLHAAAAGANEVVGLDSSEKAVEAARHNAEMNELDKACRFDVADVFERLNEMVSKGETYDCVILDPPSLVKSKRHLKQGEAAYERLNRLAMELLSVDGVLISCSCSFHISRERFQHILSAAARKSRRSAVVMEWRGQARDHPVLLAMPETSYLKCAIMRIA
jgi:23S rRNA (cytosine1962-C5)-methyltransferase